MPTRSASSHGPIGQPAPFFIAASRSSGVDARLVEHSYAVVQERDQNPVDDEARCVMATHWRLPQAHPRSKAVSNASSRGELRPHDLHERHQRRRVEEMHADDPLRRRRRRRDLGDGERGRVRREHRIGAADRSSSAKSARLGSSSSTIASITTSQPARSATFVVSVNRAMASSRSLGSSLPFSTFRRQEVFDTAPGALSELRRDLAAHGLQPALDAELGDAGAHRSEPDDADLAHLRHGCGS